MKERVKSSVSVRQVLVEMLVDFLPWLVEVDENSKYMIKLSIKYCDVVLVDEFCLV